MFRNNIEIKEGAFILGDVHYSHIRPQFLEFLKKIHSKELRPTQLILLGDIFDALVGEIPYTHKVNHEAIDIINRISLEIEVIYLEGNHDFNLQKLFTNSKLFSIDQQPLLCKYKNKKIMLAHGDFGADLGYKIYTSVIRNSFFSRLLGVVDSLSGHYIFNKLDRYLSKKDDCKEFAGFREFISKRVTNIYDCDYFIEGHFHQNKSISLEKTMYINLAAFACNQRYFIVKSSKEVTLLEEKTFS